MGGGVGRGRGGAGAPGADAQAHPQGWRRGHSSLTAEKKPADTASASTDDGTARLLGGIGIAVGVIGLGLGGYGLGRARSRA